MNGIAFKFLLVDDDQDDRLFIDEAFQEIGYAAELKKFKSGEALLHYLEQIDPSLYPSVIVLDNCIEGLNATEIIRKLNADDLLAKIPVIIHSSLLSPQTQQQLLDEGACMLIEKGMVIDAIRKFATDLKDFAERSNHSDNSNQGN
jgi:CheY-like chemotaxis protein